MRIVMARSGGAAEPAPRQRPCLVDPANILLVDDDRATRELVAGRLRAAGYAVTAAADVDAALASVHHDPPDLVVLDVEMPGRSGLDLCRGLRVHPDTAHVPVILLTARDHPDDLAAGARAGADCYVVKPFHPHSLLREVEALLCEY